MRPLSFLSCLLAAICLIFLSAPVQAMSNFIPGAHHVKVVHYDDLTTNNPAIGALSEARRVVLAPSDYSGDGKPKRMAWYTPSFPMPGQEITGMFDDAAFVIRIPDKWNGKLVMIGAPGVGDERSTDAILSDYVLTKLDVNGAGYAYACIDKGTTGELLPAPDGSIPAWSKSMTALINDKDTIEEWNQRLHQMTVATQDLLSRTRGNKAFRVYLIGMSNGGYVTRYAIEHDSQLYDGMIDWEGVLWRAKEPNIITSMVDALHAQQILADTNASSEKKQAAQAVFAHLGLPAQEQLLVPYHNKFYYLPTLNQFRTKLDPEWKHRDWWEFLGHMDDYKDYNFATRSKAHERIAAFENTGQIQKPVITIHGTHDALLFPSVHATAYQNLVNKAGKSSLYRLYMVQGGNHFDSLVGHPLVDKNQQLQPLLPYVHQAFDLMVDWVENGIAPPASKTIGYPSQPQNAIDIRNGGEVYKY